MKPYERTGSKNSNWKGGICYDRLRKGIYSPNHPNPNFNHIYVYEYVLIAEEMLGRYLKKDEIVHHRNGDVCDNRPENLEVITQSEHILKHTKDLHNEKWKENLKLNISNRDEKGKFRGRLQ